MTKIKNISLVKCNVAGLPVAPGRIADIDDLHFQNWLTSSHAQRINAECLQVVVDGPDELKRTRYEIIFAAIGTLRRDNPEAWTTQGLPNVNHLQEVTKLYDITGSERTSIWEKYSALNTVEDEDKTNDA